jgi:hypothetical protein
MAVSLRPFSGKQCCLAKQRTRRPAGFYEQICCLNKQREKIMSKEEGLKPGQEAPASGQYQIIGPRGGQGPERTVVRGEPLPLPPTPSSGSTYTLVDRTKTK